MRNCKEIVIKGRTLKEILVNHLHWINEDCENWSDMRANLSGADLSYEDLSYANLSGANLSGADLSGANLSGANLNGANLSGADLYGANLNGANLYGANLNGANLSGANWYGANLNGANLSGANWYGANLRHTDLSGADLYVPYSCPEFGSFIGYKKAGGRIVELKILSDSKRLSATGRKCRCDKAKVLGIYDYDHNLLELKEVVSGWNSNFIYRVGEVVKVVDFDENRWNECTTGIHFFINFQEAVNYNA